MNDILGSKINTNSLASGKDKLVGSYDSKLWIFKTQKKLLPVTLTVIAPSIWLRSRFNFSKVCSSLASGTRLSKTTPWSVGMARTTRIMLDATIRRPLSCCYHGIEGGFPLLLPWFWPCTSKGHKEGNHPLHKTKNRNPYGKHENIVLVLRNQSFWVEGGLFMVDA